MEKGEMILTVDIGNSSIGYALFKDGEVYFQDVISSRKDSELDYIIARLKEAIEEHKIDVTKVKAGIIASVVPGLTVIAQVAFKNVYKIKLVPLDHSFKIDVELNIDNPKELGSDLIADLVAAKRDYKLPAVIIDLGTVNKALLLDQNGVFVSSYFFPGMKSSVRSLGDEAALLPNLNRIEKPKKVLAKNTNDAIINGVFYSTLATIEGLANHYEEYLGRKVSRVITGGFSKIIAEEKKNFTFDLNLGLRGLYYLYKDNLDKFS